MFESALSCVGFLLHFLCPVVMLFLGLYFKALNAEEKNQQTKEIR